MKHSVTRFCLLMFAAPLLGACAASAPDDSEADDTADQTEAPAEPAAAGVAGKTSAFHVPLYFVENHGQLAGPATMYSQGRNATVMFGPDGLTYELTAAKKDLARKGPVHRGVALGGKKPVERETISLRFIGANRVEPQGDGVTDMKVNFFRGTESEWRTQIPSYERVVYRNLWPGIDLVYSGEGGQIKYSFIVAPGADPAQIRMAYEGPKSIGRAGDGALEIHTATRTLREAPPITLQEHGDASVLVPSRFVTSPIGDDLLEFTVAVEAYDTTLPLIIDPPAFVYAGFIGGSTDDRGLGIAVDGSGNAYVTGQTWNGLDDDVFIAKINAAGNAFTWLSILGGSGDDEGFDITVDSAGQTYVTGVTNSSNLPTFRGPDLTFNGDYDCFVSKINASGTALIYSGFVGGSGTDFCEGIVVDSSGSAYITGPTSSTQATMPVVVGPDLTYNGGSFDKFVAKIKPLPSSATVTNNFNYLGYIGGDDEDVGEFYGFITDGHIAIDSSGNAYVSGMTKSTQTTFPTGSGFGAIPGFDKTHNGGVWDGYVAKVSFSGTGLAYATYIGGAGEDRCFGMKVDSAGNAYFTGSTTSDETTFPVVRGPDLTFNGVRDAFIGRLNSTGTALAYLGYIGGTGEEEGESVALDSSGNVFIAGYADSYDGTFPAVNGPDLSENDAVPLTGDAFIAKMKANPASLTPVNNYHYCGFIGGSEYDQAFWVVVDSAGNAYVVGDTESTQATFPNGSGMGGITSFDNTAAGLNEAFVVKISP